MSLIWIFGAVAILAFSAERLWPARSQAVLRRGLLTDGVYVAVAITVRLLLTHGLGLLLVGSAQWGGPLSVASASLPLQIVVTVVVVDFIAYWVHRAKHQVEWLWRLHEAHHSSRELDWFSSVRFHPLEKVFDRIVYLLPLTLLGPSEEALLGLATVDAVVATAAHSNCRLRLGVLSFLFVGPEMHHWHHAREDIAQRSNFGNNLSVFDWLFGTGHLPEERPDRFGIESDEYPPVGFWAQFRHAFRPLEVATGWDAIGPAGLSASSREKTENSAEPQTLA